MTAGPGEGDQVASRADHFRPDVEGLRAIAVVLVLLYHARFPFFGGGYVGVDVFFVISGFLITGLLLRELDSTGRLSFTGFYARRARRLLPASGLTLIVTLIASVLLLAPVRITDVATDIASAAAYVSNFRFGLQANDYFQANAAPSPVLHFWSLSVEEQFYVFWPTVLFVLVRFSGRLHIGRRGLFVGVSAVSIASLIGCIWLTGQNPAWAFYLLPTRAWELGLGALLAVSAGRVKLPGRQTAAAFMVLGLAAIAAAALAFNDTTLFPGYAAMLPVAGAGLVILGGFRGSAPARLLSLPPFTFLGRISYSVYLWHWPMLLFAGVLYGSELPQWLSLLVALAAIPVATVTQRLVEQPFRIGRFIGTRPRVNLGQALASTLVIAVAAGGASVYASRQADTTLGDLIPPISDIAQFDPGGWCPSQPDDPSTCVHGVPTSSTHVVVFGDSLGAQWFGAFNTVATERGWRLVALSRGWCPTADVDVINGALGHVEPECRAWREQAFARIAAEHPDLVIVTNHRWQPVVDGQPVGPAAEQAQIWSDGLDRTLARLKGLAKAVVVLGETPVGSDPAECLEGHIGDFGACARTRATVANRQGVERTAAASNGATYVDPTVWMCQGDVCPAVIDRYIVYMDTTHLTPPFATSLAPDVDAALSPLVTPGSLGAAPSAVPFAGSSVLSDSFSRSVSTGWGSPDSGPAWAGTPAGASVDGSSGQLTAAAAPGGQFQGASLGAGNLEISARWNLDAVPAGAPVTVHFWPRDVDSGDQYRFYVTVTPSGDLFANFAAAVAGKGTQLGSPVRVGSGYVPGDWWHVRVQASGASPTTLRARLWKDGTPEPTTWSLELTDSTASLQAASQAVHLGINASSGETTLPLHAGFDDITVTASP